MAAGLKTLELISAPGFYDQLAAKVTTLMTDLKERAAGAVAEVDAAATHVAGVAGDEAGNVVHEAKDAARGFFA